MKHEEIVAGIRNLESHPEFSLRYGICYNVRNTMGIRLENRVFHLYPNFSGNTSYPVKHPTIPDPFEAYEEYEEYGEEEDYWKGEYGEERRKFLQWLADNIQPDWYSEL